MHRGMRPASDPVDIADFETSVGDGVAACIYRQIERVDFRLAVHLRHAGARDHAILLEISGHILRPDETARSEEHTSELQSLMRISYAVFCLKKKKTIYPQQYTDEI